MKIRGEGGGGGHRTSFMSARSVSSLVQCQSPASAGSYRGQVTSLLTLCPSRARVIPWAGDVSTATVTKPRKGPTEVR